MKAILLIPALALSSACASFGRPPVAPELTVLVYNIHAGKDAGGVDNLARIASLVLDTGADLVLLQEVDSATTRSGGVDQMAQLRQSTGLHGAFGSTLAYQGGQYGLGLLSRHPIVSSRIHPLPNDPPQPRAGGSREPRGALHAVVRLADGDLHLLNTHIDAGADDRWRRQEGARLVAIADSLRATGARVLVGGDLNSLPESAVQDLLRTGGLRDVWPLCGQGDGHTFPARDPVRRIDYLYLTGDAACTSARVLATDASDHRPLLVKVSVR